MKGIIACSVYMLTDKAEKTQRIYFFYKANGYYIY